MVKFKKKKLIANLITFVLGILPLIITTIYLFTKDPPVWLDEGLFLDMSRHLAKSGQIKTHLFNKAIPGLESHAYWYPPIYFYYLSFWSNIFGTTIESIRAASFIISFITLIIYFFTLKIIFQKLIYVFIGLSMLSFDIWFSGASHFARMDILCFFFQLTSFYLFIIAFKKYQQKLFVVSGIFSGLAILTHPLGSIMPIIIITFLSFRLLIEQKSEVFKALTYSFTPIIFLILLWLISIKNDFELFLTQFHLQIIRKFQMTPYVFTLFKQYAPFKFLIIFYSIITILLMVKIKLLKKLTDILIILGLISSVIILTGSKEMWYLLYFQPFISYALISLYSWFSEDKIRIIRLLGSIMIVAFFLIHTSFYLTILNNVRINHYNYHQFVNYIRMHLPYKASIFIASFPDPYMDLKNEKSLNLYEFPTVPVNDKSYKELLDGVDYIILSGWIPDFRVKKYIESNQQTSFTINHKNGYKSTIIKLKPLKERI